MGGLASLIDKDPALAELAHRTITAPRIAVNRVLFQRAIDRGEARPDCDVELISLVSSAMASYRTLMLRTPVDRAYLVSIIDEIILPAVLKR